MSDVKSIDELKITAHKDVWLCWTNADLTEGKGSQYIKFVCETEATALRAGKKGSVMGSDCPISKGFAVMVDGVWLYPGRFKQATKEDLRRQLLIDECRAAQEKARALGLTDDDIKKIASATTHGQAD